MLMMMGSRSARQGLGQFFEGAYRYIDRHLRPRFSCAGSVLIRSSYMSRAQSNIGGRFQIAAVRGHHHALTRLEAERLSCDQVDAGLGLVIACDLRAENRVPGKVVSPGKVDHQGDVAVGNRREQEAAPQAVQPGRYVLPGIEPVPRKVQVL